MVIVLWITLGLVSIALYFAHSMALELRASDNRASAVKNALVAGGVSADRIKTVSYGKEKPFCTEHTEQCWQQNRRGHFVYSK